MANTAKDTKEKPITPDDKKPAQQADDKAVHSPSAPSHAAPGLDLAGLSDEQLSGLITSAQSALEGRRAKKQSDFLASIREQALALGLDPVAIAAALAKRGSGNRPRSGGAGAGDKRAAVKPKYRNPANPSQTWAGRGAKPAWIELGPDKKPLAKFSIPETVA